MPSGYLGCLKICNFRLDWKFSVCFPSTKEQKIANVKSATKTNEK